MCVEFTTISLSMYYKNKNTINNKIIFLTGGTGSFGKKFVEFILKTYRPSKIVIFSRDELKQYEMMKKFDPKKLPIEYFVGDIRDYERLLYLTKNVDIVVHAAALKQVPTAELNPSEFIKTNVIGSENVIRASTLNEVKKVIALSTDKACSPINLYGATKLTADKLFVSANYSNLKKTKTLFSVVRYGNVLGSRGSVLPLFLEQQKDKFFTITDAEMTRFIITLSEGVKFVINSIHNMIGGEIFVPKIPSIKILDLAKAINPEKNIKYIGIRPGEKLHEIMISKDDAYYTYDCGDYFVISPSLPWWRGIEYNFNIKNGKKVKIGFDYSSDNNPSFLNISKITKLISKYIKS